MASLNATVGIITTPFKRGLDQMRAETQKWGGDLKSTIAGAFAFSAVASFVSNFVGEMARIKDLADRLGESSQTIQRVGNAAKLSGTDLEFVIKTLNKMTLAAAKGAEEFEKAGINASEFANAGMEQKILMLSAAYDEANGSQEKMLNLMAALGPKGQDMLILLSQGSEELNSQLSEVSTVSDSAVAAMAKFDDAIDASKQKLTSWLGGLVDAYQTAVMWASAFIQATGSDFSAREIFDATKKTQKEDEESAKNTKKKDFQADDKDAAKDAEKHDAGLKALEQEKLNLARSRMDAEQKIADLKREQAEYAAKTKDPYTEDLESAKKVLEIQQQIEAGEADLAKKKAAENENAARKKKAEDEAVAKSEESLADEQNRQRLDKMDPAARIAELKKQQQALNDDADKDPDKKSAADKKLEALRMNSEIDAAQKEMDGKHKEGAQAQQALEEEQNKQRLAKMNPAERIAELKRQQKELNDAAAKESDPKARADKKLEALKLNDEIDAAQKELAGKKDGAKPSVISSSLASIGGGGRAYIGADPALAESRRQTSLLQQLVRNTSGQGGGGAPAQSRNPF